MRRQNGFTLIEIMMVVAILGILGATAIPVFRTWQMRSRGSEAAVMAKQILDAQIVYYLDNDEFYPPDDTIEIYHGDPPDGENVQKIANNLNITIPTDHFLDYSFWYDSENGEFRLQIDSDVQIFKEGYGIQYIINNKGEVSDPLYL